MAADDRLPDWVEEAIAEQEKILTAWVREKTGRDDLDVKYDRRHIKLEPAPEPSESS